MKRSVALLALALVALVPLLGKVARAGETRLRSSELSLLFGGIAPTKTCCLTIDACNVAAQTCGIYTTMTTCLNGSSIMVQNQYSKNCQAPNPPCPNCSCADFQNDANGKMYFCATYYACQWSNGTCSINANNMQKQTQGYYSCADNCP
jgi:hypothetical protein